MKLARLAVSLWLVAAGAASQTPAAVPASTWQAVVRQAPLWESQGVQHNLATIRRWVLAGEGYCTRKDRHMLFDRRMRAVGFLSDVGDSEANQDKINAVRAELAAAGKVDAWVPGEIGKVGYPFVLSCHQPDAQLAELVAGYRGTQAAARLWGTWDGMQIGQPDAQVSLHEAIRAVYEYRVAMGRLSLPRDVLYLLAGKVIIESGGAREARSTAGARGVMQLSAEVLSDCGIAQRFHLHRLAQIDCALYLLQQNHRNLQPLVQARFADLPQAKQQQLLQMLLVQAYHSGLGRVIALLGDEALGAPARYFATHHARFTAGDIALGMVFHNLGRESLGFASLYYVTDVFIAAAEACRQVDEGGGESVCPPHS